MRQMFKKRCTCIIFWALVAMVSFACKRPLPLPEIPTAGIDPVVATQISDTLTELRDAPRSGEAWGKLGMVLKAADMESKAQECFLRAEHLNPKDPRWPYFQGTIESLKRATALTEQAFIRSRLGQMLLEAGRFAEAEEQFAAAGNALGLAQVACAQGNWEKAVTHLEHDRGSKAATALLANVSLRRGQAEEARSLSIEAAGLPPDIPPPNPFEAELARYEIGKRAWIEETQRLLAQGQMQQAAGVVDRLITSYPNASEGWLYLGRLHLVQNNLPQAEQALARHLQLDPASVDGHLQMGLVHHRQNRLAEAASEFKRALESKPDSETAHYFLGIVQRAQGDRQSAARSFKEALRHQPTFEAARKALDEIPGSR